VRPCAPPLRPCSLAVGNGLLISQGLTRWVPEEESLTIQTGHRVCISSDSKGASSSSLPISLSTHARCSPANAAVLCCVVLSSTHAHQGPRSRGKFGIGRVSIVRDRWIALGSNRPSATATTNGSTDYLGMTTLPVMLPRCPSSAHTLRMTLNIDVVSAVTPSSCKSLLA
jgi:hypothetical protein